jgi:hypothetical protein
MTSRSFSLDTDEDEDEGLAPRAIRSLLRLLNNDARRKSVVVVSSFEIVNDLIVDLCVDGTSSSSAANEQSSSPRRANDQSPRRRGGGGGTGTDGGNSLSLSETKSGEVVISGLSEWTFQVDGIGNDDTERVVRDGIFKILRSAAARRRQGGIASATVAGKASSYRPSLSHMIIRIKVQHMNDTSDSRASSPVLSESTTLTFADLAGAEKLGGQGGASDARSPRDAKNANEALASLEILFSAMRRGAKHIPYRDSKLTFSLKNELSGSAQVICVSCVSQEESDAKETINILAFSESCRSTLLKRNSSSSFRDSPRSM